MNIDTQKAKEQIKAEFMNRYEQWLKDRFELDDHDYGWKYGWQKSERLMKLKDNLTAVAFFQKYICSFYWTVKSWEKFGIDKQTVWELANEKWLSEQVYWKNGKSTVYFVSQQKAKEIWKEARGK